jgi:hypothetical protein
VSRETLFHEVWGEIFVTDGSLTRCIAELRRIFDDDVREPRVIQTIAKQDRRRDVRGLRCDVAPAPRLIARSHRRYFAIRFGLFHRTRASSMSPRKLDGMTSPQAIQDSLRSSAPTWKLP